MSDTIDSNSESGRSVDTDEGNWLTRNFWMIKGFLAAAVLVAFAVGSLFYFENAMANVLWAMGVTMAGLVVLVQVAIGVVRSVASV